MTANNPGQVTLIARNPADGSIVLQVDIFSDPSGSGAFDVNPAIVVNNQTGGPVTATFASGATTKTVPGIPVGTTNVAQATLAAKGVTNWSQFPDGISVSAG